MLKRLMTASVLAATFLLTGCVNNMALKKPLPKNTRIAVVTNFSPVGQFARQGVTVFGHVRFTAQIPGLNINQFLRARLAMQLASLGYNNIIKINATPNELLAMGGGQVTAVDNNIVSPAYRRYLSRIVAGRNVQKILLMVPAATTLLGKWAENVYGYGMFNVGGFLMSASQAFIQYKLFVIDTSNYTVLAHYEGSSMKRISGMDFKWGKGAAGAKPSDLRKVGRGIKKMITTKLRGKLRSKLGL